jgi:mRNA interferase HigB
MRIVARRTLREFVDTRLGRKDYSAVKAAVASWHHEVQQATWKSMADVKRHYATASPITSDRVVFNIKGNDYRLVAAIDFEKAIVWIKWIGSHADYDKIDVKKVQHGK